MIATPQNQLSLPTIDFTSQVVIAAPIDIAFEALLEEIGPEGEMMGGSPFPMKLEAWPGGRWFRDLGNNTGHHWGHVQVIKPPKLLEISGPLFISFPAMNHVQWKLTSEGESGQATRLQFTHRGVGQIPVEIQEGVSSGWQYRLDRVDRFAQQILQRK